MNKNIGKEKCTLKQKKNATVISKNEFSRIVNNAGIYTTQQDHEDAIREERKQRIKEAKELAKKIGPNPVAGQVLAKRQYAVETELAGDQLEIETRLMARKDRVLDMAYKRLFEQTDRVKYFKAAKNYAELVTDRDLQVAKKAEQQDLFAKYDAEFLVGMLKDVDNYHEEELDKKKVKEKNKVINKDNWIRQHGEVIQKRDKERSDNLRDGYLIWNDVEKEKQRESQQIKHRNQEVQKYKTALEHQIEEQCHLFDVHQKLDEAQEAKAKLFNDFKRQVNLEHKKVKDKLDKEKDLKRQFVAENLADDTIERKIKEETNLQKAVRQAEERAKEKDALKRLNQEEAEKAFKDFYNNEMSAKRKQAFEEKLKDCQDGRMIADNIEKLKQMEDSKVQRHDDLENEAQHIQLHQIAQKRTEKRAEDIEGIKDYMEHMRGLDEEEEMFQKYAQMEIAKCESRGIDTYAMRKAAQPGIECGKGPLFKDRGHIRPRYYAAGGRTNDLVHVHRQAEADDTKSRLGFTL